MAEITVIAVAGGQPGISGSRIYVASGAPAPTLGANNDVYLDDVSGDLYFKVAGIWNLEGNFFGPQGIQGIQGIQGPVGPSGQIGSQIYTASGAPGSGLGIDGDFYINTSNSDYYKKITGAWVLQGNFQGIQGLQGSQLRTGSGVPSNGLGNNTDFYIDNDQGNYYLKAAGVYTLQGQLAGGALRFSNMWDAGTNTPALASGVGTEGEIYIVTAQGTTMLDGLSTWNIRDWAVFLNSAWRKVENNTVDDSIGDSITTRAPSQNAVFDALALKRNIADPIVDADVDAAAAIARTKLASGANYRVVTNGATGVMTDAAAITASRALASDANGIPTHSTTSAAELDFVTGVTSAIQTQIDGKEPTITVLPEAKGGTNQSTYATGDTIYASAANTLAKRTIGSTGQVSKVVGGIPTWEDWINPASETRLFEDWIGDAVGTLRWLDADTTTGVSATSLTNNDANHPGILELDTGIGTTGAAIRYLGGVTAGTSTSGFLVGGGSLMYEWLARFPTLSDVTNEFTFSLGMTDTISAPTAFISLSYNRASSGVNWQGLTRSASVTTTTDLGVVAAAATWYKLGVVVNAAGTNVDFYIDGVLVGSSVTNIPTGTVIAPRVNMTKSAGTTARSAHVDYFKLYQRFTAAR